MFPLSSAAPGGLVEGLLAPCRGLVELVEAWCEQRRRPPPPGVSYVIFGSVAVVSLDERLRGREVEVARRILEAHPHLEAVYGKEATVGEHRVQRLRLLAGRPVDVTLYREHGLVYPVKPGLVYVNPRLATEHARVASLVEQGERVLDMFAGFGGFSLLIASTGKPRIVVANDVNPYAVEAMLGAARLNASRLRSPLLVLGMDARALPSVLAPVFDRVIMNLPHAAKGFLPVARSLCSQRGCVVHLYTVASTPGEALQGLPRWARPLAPPLRVLDYAPRRFIYRVDLRLHPQGGVVDEQRVADTVAAGEQSSEPAGQRGG